MRYIFNKHFKLLSLIIGSPQLTSAQVAEDHCISESELSSVFGDIRHLLNAPGLRIEGIIFMAVSKSKIPPLVEPEDPGSIRNKIFNLICLGYCLAHITRELDISLFILRSNLKALFKAYGAKSQRDLIIKVLTHNGLARTPKELEEFLK